MCVHVCACVYACMMHVSILTAILTGEKYGIIGYFSAYVGSRECVGGQ